MTPLPTAPSIKVETHATPACLPTHTVSVASLWDVRDEATSELIRRFYERMFKEGLKPAAALRVAQVSMWNEKRWEAPYHGQDSCFRASGGRLDYGPTFVVPKFTEEEINVLPANTSFTAGNRSVPILDLTT